MREGWLLPITGDSNGCPESPHNFTWWQNVGYKTTTKTCGEIGMMQDLHALSCVEWKTYNVPDSCSRATVQVLVHTVWPSSGYSVSYNGKGGMWDVSVANGGCDACLKGCNLHNDSICINSDSQCYAWVQEYADLVSGCATIAGIPEDWICKVSSYDGDDGCQCFCGAWDPDCDKDPMEQPTTDCNEGATCIPPGVCHDTQELMTMRKQIKYAFDHQGAGIAS